MKYKKKMTRNEFYQAFKQMEKKVRGELRGL